MGTVDVQNWRGTSHHNLSFFLYLFWVCDAYNAYSAGESAISDHKNINEDPTVLYVVGTCKKSPEAILLQTHYFTILQPA